MAVNYYQYIIDCVTKYNLLIQAKILSHKSLSGILNKFLSHQLFCPTQPDDTAPEAVSEHTDPLQK